MTAVLWIEEPKTCADCPCVDSPDYTDKKYCKVKQYKEIRKDVSRPRWCPLMLLDVEQPYKTEKEKKS